MHSFKPLSKNHKITDKGYSHKLLHLNKFDRNKKLKYTKLYFFNDFGTYAYVYSVTLHTIGGKSTERPFLLSVENGRLNIRYQSRPISNNPSKLVEIIKKRPMMQKRFKSIFYAWLRRNGIKIKKKFQKYSLEKLMLVLARPGVEYINDVYPKIFLDFPNCRLNSILTQDFKNPKGINHIFTRIFGSKGKSIKALITKYPHQKTLIAGRVLKGLVPLDYISSLSRNIIDILANIEIGSYAKTVRKFLKNYSSDTIINWFNQINSGNLDNHSFIDTIYMVHRVEIERLQPLVIPNTNNLQEIHDDFSRQLGRMQAMGHKPPELIEFPNIVEKYKDIIKEFGEFRLEIPKDTKVLEEYSLLMSNCIGRIYRTFMNQEGCLLLGVYKNGELKYNLSLRNKIIEQFLGKFNQQPNPEDKEIILKYLQDNKFINPPQKVVDEPENLIDTQVVNEDLVLDFR